MNNKAQSLTELATFGSVLLLVMSFFVRYGMNYIYQQDTNMRAFRMALNDAYNTAPDSSSSLMVIKDKHMPDPQDTFGVGNVVSVQGGGDVAWGNTLQDKPEDPSDLSKIPKIKFVINEGTHEYTTAGFATIAKIGTSVSTPNPVYCDGFYVKLSGSDQRTRITWDQVRCFKPEGALEPQAMVLLLPSRETEIINELALSDKSPMKQIIRILPTGLSHGNAVTGFDVLDRQAGQINPDYFALNADLYDDGNYDGNPDVDLEHLQGILPTDITVNRGDTLSLEERSAGGGYYKSVDKITTAVTVTHKIGKNKLEGGNVVPDPDGSGRPVRDIEPIRQIYEITGVSKAWQTQK